MNQKIYTLDNKGKPKEVEDKLPNSIRTDLTYLGKDNHMLVLVSTVFTGYSMGKGTKDLPQLWRTDIMINTEVNETAVIAQQIKKANINGGKFTSMAAAKSYHHQIVTELKEKFSLSVM
jgi:hypothetical protein